MSFLFDKKKEKTFKDLQEEANRRKRAAAESHEGDIFTQHKDLVTTTEKIEMAAQAYAEEEVNAVEPDYIKRQNDKYIKMAEKEAARLKAEALKLKEERELKKRLGKAGPEETEGPI